MFLSFNQSSKDLGRQVLNKSLWEWIDKTDNVFILFSAEIDHKKRSEIKEVLHINLSNFSA